MTFFLHASSLPTHADCARRWASSNVPSIKKMLQGDGTAQQNIGAVIGTISHEAAARMLKQKFDIGVTPDWQNPLALALQEYYKQIQLPTRWDDITREPSAGALQVENLIKEFVVSYLPYAVPAVVEEPMSVRINDQIIFVGRPDIILARNVLDDFKFGTRLQGYQAQFGGYIKLFLELTGEVIDKCAAVHFKRVGASKPQPEMERVEYSPEACYQAAQCEIRNIVSELRTFDDTKNIWAFPTNPNSKLCTQTACRAFGTPACDQWRIS